MAKGIIGDGNAYQLIAGFNCLKDNQGIDVPRHLGTGKRKRDTGIKCACMVCR